MKLKGIMKDSVRSLILMVLMVAAMSITAAAAEPTNVTQITDTETSVKVQWTGVAGAKYYGVQIATDPGFANIVKQDYTSVSFQSMYLTGLASGSTYYVRVGWGVKSNSCYANFSAPVEVVTAPTAITAVKFVGADDATATLAWDPVPGANLYMVEYNDQTFQAAANSIALPYAPGVSYAKVSPAKTTSTGAYIAKAGTTSVYDITALTGKISKDNFGFVNAWTSINVFQIGANYYGHGLEVNVYDAKTGKKKFSGSTENTTYGSVEFRKFKYNTMYKYRVRAYAITTDGQKFYGGWSSYRYFVNPKKSNYTTSGRKIKLSWSKLKGVSKIKIQVSTKENSGYKTCATLSGSKTSYTISKYGKNKLKKGKTYYFKITYYAKSGKKTYSGDIISTGSTKIR